MARPFAAVAAFPVKYLWPLRRMRTETSAPATGRRPVSITVAVTSTAFLPIPYLIEATRTTPGVTVRLALPEIGPLAPVTVAVRVPDPPRTPAVKVVVRPCAGLTEPRVDGVIDHVGGSGEGFPNVSSALALKAFELRALTVAEAGVTLTLAGGPGWTVSVWTPLVKPGAAAVIVGVPARVSW